MAPRRAAATATSHECRSRRRARDTRSTLSNSAGVFRPPTTLAAGLQQPEEKGNDDKESRPAPRAGRPRAASTHCARPRVGVWSWLGRLPDGAGRRGSASPGRGGSRRHPKARGHSRGRRAPTFPPPPPPLHWRYAPVWGKSRGAGGGGGDRRRPRPPPTRGRAVGREAMPPRRGGGTSRFGGPPRQRRRALASSPRPRRRGLSARGGRAGRGRRREGRRRGGLPPLPPSAAAASSLKVVCPRLRGAESQGTSGRHP